VRLKDTEKHWGFPQAEAEKPEFHAGSRYIHNIKVIRNGYYSNTSYRLDMSEQGIKE